MLKRALDLKEAITKFRNFYKSPTSRSEFSNPKTKLDAMEEKEWVTIHRICHLLGSFDSATKLLSGEKYSLFVTAFPVLWKVKEKSEMIQCLLSTRQMLGHQNLKGCSMVNMETSLSFKT